MAFRITATFLVAATLVGGSAMALMYGLRDGLLLALVLVPMGFPS